MRQNRFLLLVGFLLLTVFVSALTVTTMNARRSPTAVAQAKQDSVYDRVMRTGTIRCGYGLWSVYLNKDPNTGKMGGIYYDYMEALGKNLHLKIEWTEEVGWGDFVTALTNDRFDVYCTLVALNAERARQVDFLSPLFYLPSDVFVSVGDMRFDNDLNLLNAPDVTLTTMEGDIYDKISAAEYPLAKKMELPELASEAELFSTLADHKADAAITETTAGLAYMQNNPGKIRMIKENGPFRALPASISVKGGEYRFQRMLEIATMEMKGAGVLDKILRKNDPAGEAYIPVAKSYGQEETH